MSFKSVSDKIEIALKNFLNEKLVFDFKLTLKDISLIEEYWSLKDANYMIFNSKILLNNLLNYTKVNYTTTLFVNLSYMKSRNTKYYNAEIIRTSFDIAANLFLYDESDFII